MGCCIKTEKRRKSRGKGTFRSFIKQLQCRKHHVHYNESERKREILTVVERIKQPPEDERNKLELRERERERECELSVVLFVSLEV